MKTVKKEKTLDSGVKHRNDDTGLDSDIRHRNDDRGVDLDIRHRHRNDDRGVDAGVKRGWNEWDGCNWGFHVRGVRGG